MKKSFEKKLILLTKELIKILHINIKDKHLLLTKKLINLRKYHPIHHIKKLKNMIIITIKSSN